jgi:cytochrome P450
MLSNQHRSDKEFMSRAEIEATSTILILGGSETSATLLSAAVYYLLTHPHVKQKLVGEIRGDFRQEEQMNFITVNKFDLSSSLREGSFRIFPPVVFGSPRIVEGNGKAIDGVMVPGGVSIEPLRSELF